MDILLKTGVAGDFKEDCEDMEAISARLEALRDSEVVDEPFLREKRPMVRDRWDGCFTTWRGRDRSVCRRCACCLAYRGVLSDKARPGGLMPSAIAI